VDLVFSWLYQEYASCMNMVSISPESNKQNMASYDECLTIILDGLMNLADQKERLVLLVCCFEFEEQNFYV